jgi:hypothetical protein
MRRAVFTIVTTAALTAAGLCSASNVRSFDYRGAKLGDSVDSVSERFSALAVHRVPEGFVGRIKVPQEELTVTFTDDRKLWMLEATQLIRPGAALEALKAKAISKYGKPEAEIRGNRILTLEYCDPDDVIVRPYDPLKQPICGNENRILRVTIETAQFQSQIDILLRDRTLVESAPTDTLRF